MVTAIEYPKIPTLYERGEDHKVRIGRYLFPEFEYLKNCLWHTTEKIDGSNIRIYWNGKTVRFMGRTENSQIPTHLLHMLQDMFPLGKFINYEDICLYGEGYGRKIQKNGHQYLSDSTNFRLFDVRIGNWWLEDIDNIADSLEIERVPVIGRFNLKTATEFISEGGFLSLFSESIDLVAEGVVIQPVRQLFNRKGERIIAKLKVKDF